jgi:hypothetical protein
MNYVLPSKQRLFSKFYNFWWNFYASQLAIKFRFRIEGYGGDRAWQGLQAFYYNALLYYYTALANLFFIRTYPQSSAIMKKIFFPPKFVQFFAEVNQTIVLKANFAQFKRSEQFCCLSFTHLLSPSPSLSLSHTHTLTHTHKHSHTHTHTHTSQIRWVQIIASGSLESY